MRFSEDKRIEDMRTLSIAILFLCILGVVAYIIKAFFFLIAAHLCSIPRKRLYRFRYRRLCFLFERVVAHG